MVEGWWRTAERWLRGSSRAIDFEQDSYSKESGEVLIRPCIVTYERPSDHNPCEAFNGAVEGCGHYAAVTGLPKKIPP